MTTVGHNSKRTKAGPVVADRLRSFIERVEKLLEERKAIQSDIKDVFSEAKGVGYDVKTMRKLITVRAMDAADRAEQETLLDTYAHALGMETTPRELTEEELVERAGRIVEEVDRCMELVVDGQLPKIAAIQESIGCSLGKASKIRGLVADRISRLESDDREMKNETIVEMAAEDLGAYRPWLQESVPEMTADDLGDPLLVIDKPRAQFREKIRAAAASVSCRKAPEASATVSAPAPVDSWDDIAAEHADLDAKRRAFLARASA